MIYSAFLSFIIWLYLIFGHAYFWIGGPWLGAYKNRKRIEEPYLDVAIIVPARDEESSIVPVLNSLLQQDYQGNFRIILVDDESRDNTLKCAQNVPDPHGRLKIIKGKPHPDGWSGKLWAVWQGQEEALQALPKDGYLFLTDADIVHAKDHLSTLVNKTREDKLDMVSEMVQLNCTTFWESIFVPAFIYFFTLLYPFRKIADPNTPLAGAAGGSVLLSRHILERIGGIQSLKGALIDDCTLGSVIKKAGGRLYLGFSEQAWSIRTYQGFGSLWHMVARNAYVQLKYCPFYLVFAMVMMSLIWVMPVCLLIWAKGAKRWLGGASYGLCCVSFYPTISWFNLPIWRIFPLPFISLLYMMATLHSAFNYYRGIGVKWRGRSYDK